MPLTDSIAVCYMTTMPGWILPFAIVCVLILVAEVVIWYWRPEARRLRQIRRIGKHP